MKLTVLGGRCCKKDEHIRDRQGGHAAPRGSHSRKRPEAMMTASTQGPERTQSEVTRCKSDAGLSLNDSAMRGKSSIAWAGRACRTSGVPQQEEAGGHDDSQPRRALRGPRPDPAQLRRRPSSLFLPTPEAACTRSSDPPRAVRRGHIPQHHPALVVPRGQPTGSMLAHL